MTFVFRQSHGLGVTVGDLLGDHISDFSLNISYACMETYPYCLPSALVSGLDVGLIWQYNVRRVKDN